MPHGGIKRESEGTGVSNIVMRNIRRMINWWPPFLGAGIRVTRWDVDWRAVDVEMKLRRWNQNYVGTHYGGSLYSMTDPFYMVMLIGNLGREYVVWDKSVAAFRSDLKKLAARIENPPTDLLAPIPHANNQSLLNKALLVADHNAYHIGQLVLVRRLLSSWP